MEMDSEMKPTLDVDNLEDHKVVEKRRKTWKRHLKSALYISKNDKQKVAYVLHKWRKKQRELLGQKDIEDPDPFVETYVFYCLGK